MSYASELTIFATFRAFLWLITYFNYWSDTTLDAATTGFEFVADGLHAATVERVTPDEQ